MARAERFTVDKIHLALAKRLYISSSGNAYGDAPSVDQKRPYGNSDVLGDLKEIYAATEGLEIVNIEDGGTLVLSGDRVISRGDGTGDPLSDVESLLQRYHRDMTTVLQILLQNLSISEGVYERESPYGGHWARVEG